MFVCPTIHKFFRATRVVLIVSCLATVATSTAIARQDSQTQQMVLETVCEGLNRPCGVTIDQTTGLPIVANSGAGAIVQIVDGVPRDLIVGFQIGEPAEEFPGTGGPLGLALIRFESDRRALVVGTGGRGPGIDRIAAYPFSGDDQPRAGNPIAAEAELFSRTLNATDGREAQHFFYGVAGFGEVIWFTTRGDASAGWIGQFALHGGQAGKCQRLIPTAELVGRGNPAALGISPDGFVVVANCGQPGSTETSVIGFYDMESGGLRGRFETDLDDIVALAWSPVSGQLYALDFSRDNPARSGLYRLIAAEQNSVCRSELIQRIPHPAAMHFAPDGSLLITSLGENPAADTGKLLRVSGLGVTPKSDSNDQNQLP